MFDLVVDVVRSLVIIIALLTGMAYMTWFERRAISRLQIRIGPNRVGPSGLMQPVADALKLFFKEDLRPDMADPFLYPLAPGISLVAALAGLSDAGARYFAERVAEACYGSVAVNHRVLDLLEELGVRIPAGFR